MMNYHETKAGDETIQLLRDVPNKNHQNYQTYQDLCSHALGSLKLLAIPGPKQVLPEVKRFRGNIFLPIQIYKEINEYLDTSSLNSLRCTSKSLKAAIDAAEAYDPSRNKPLYRIDPNNFLNKLRGIVSNTELSHQSHLQTLPDEESYLEGQDISTLSVPQTWKMWKIGVVVLVFIFLGLIFSLLIRRML